MAKNTSNFDLNSLKKDIEKYVLASCRYAASQIADELTEEARLSIEKFYDDYSPNFYERHFYNFRNNSYRRYYSNPHNTIFRGGVEFTPNLMEEIYQKGHSAYEVFGSVIEVGSHGPELYTTVPFMTPSPMEQVISKRDEIIKNIDVYINKAKTKAKNGTYSVLSFN